MLTTAMVATPLFPGAALAQSAPAGGEQVTALGDLVVTARRREETLQEIPASVTALSSETIERGGVRNIEDVARLTPGLTFVSLGSNFALPVIRGLSTNVGESNVGFFIDGVYQGSRSGMDRQLSDVERIEVIKGPQVALYGRNAFGGAINVITRAPSNDPSFRASTTVGQYDRLEGSAVVSGPLVQDRLFGRLGMSYAERGGFYTNDLTGEDLDDRRASTLSGALLWQASDAVSFDLRASWEDTSTGDNPGYFSLNDNPVLFAGRSQILLGEVPTQTKGFAVTPGGFDRESSLVSLTGRWDISPTLQASSITAYSQLESQQRTDNDYGPASLGFQTQDTDLSVFSQEFRLDYAGTNIDALLGLYYSDQEQASVDLDMVTSPALEAALPGSLRSTLLRNTETSEVMALFGSVTWRFAPAWSVDVAGRFFREEKNLDPFQSNPYTNVVLTPNPALSLTEEHFTPSLALSWEVTENARLYGSVARGVKTGGFNALANVTAAERYYDAETSWNYELGLKTSLMDRRLYVNAALFQIQWEDQIVRALGSLGATLNANAGQTTSQGVELEVLARPTEGLNLTAGYTYTDATFDDYYYPSLQASFGLDPLLDGKTLQYVSKHMFTASAQYQASLVNDWDWFVRGDLNHRSRQYGTTTNMFWVGAQTKVNFAFGFENPRWAIEFWARNLLDDETPGMSIQQRNRRSAALPPAGQGVFQTLAFAPEPRNAGVTLRFRY
ncbi:TonB-dependent receptor [Brevundimonas sp.]|uniref:TonB-dependent receptor n=1 Tax=Brevundimonas sp. TaxID=1871086 RepID=UPI0025BE5334|nr:TonB-dependent receptor [Brevundimonas sp.]